VAIPEFIYEGMDPCSLAQRWGIDDRLADRLVRLAASSEIPFNIISGFRSEEHQNRLRAEGRPTADNDRSTHLSCPATGVDLSPTIFMTPMLKARLGAEAELVGLRWGGNSAVDPRTGIPSDWGHFDMGPRG